MGTIKEALQGIRDVLNRATFADDVELLASADRKLPAFDLQQIPLDTGFPITKPYEVAFPFRSFTVIDATDSACSAKLVLHARTKGEMDNALPIKLGTSMNLPALVSEAYVIADAQPGKKLWIIFMREGEHSTGRNISVTSGGVSISSGDSLTTLATATVTGSATLVCAADSTRKQMLLSNYGSQPVYFGDASVTTLTGTILEVGSTLVWDAQANLYMIAASGSHSIARNQLK